MGILSTIWNGTGQAATTAPPATDPVAALLAPYEYKTVAVDGRPKQQTRDLERITRDGWEVVTINTRSVLHWGHNKADVTLKRRRG